MPLTERFQARPNRARRESCPLSEITSFVVDNSRSRKSSFVICCYIMEFGRAESTYAGFEFLSRDIS